MLAVNHTANRANSSTKKLKKLAGNITSSHSLCVEGQDCWKGLERKCSEWIVKRSGPTNSEKTSQGYTAPRALRVMAWVWTRREAISLPLLDAPDAEGSCRQCCILDVEYIAAACCMLHLTKADAHAREPVCRSKVPGFDSLWSRPRKSDGTPRLCD